MPARKTISSSDDDRQRPLGVLLRGLAEGHHAVGHRLDARHRRASAGEDLCQQPQREHRRADRQMRRRDDGVGMATAPRSRRTAPTTITTQQRADEQVGRNQERRARVLHAAHVDQRQDKQNAQAERQRVRLQARKRRDQRSNTRRDADRRVQDVVDHQRRRSQQAGASRPGSRWQPYSCRRHADTHRSSAGTRSRRWPAAQ